MYFRTSCKKQNATPGQENKQKHQEHVLDELAALKVPHKTSQLYGKMVQNLCPDLYENVSAQINFLTQSAIFVIKEHENY